MPATTSRSRRSVSDLDKALAIARERFGYAGLRPGQQEAIESVLAGRDTLAVMPTGSGKSAIYQIPAVAMPGPTVVISPLIALQKDQMETLAAQEVGGAAVVNSSTPRALQREAFEGFEGGSLEFLFLTPEQLAKPEILTMLQEAEPSLFVVDEAHCVSEWGHDFRPDYLTMGRAIEALGHPLTLALTATAGEDVRNEIVQRLCMRDPAVIVHGFDRPNLHLAVEKFKTEEEKLEQLLRRVGWAEMPGIVYVSSRRHAEQIAAALIESGVEAVAYHGGMTAKQRSPIQDAFMRNEAKVIVATSAFGMGVDKPNVRFVYHYDAPHSIDSYYQEMGRAGRDGERSEIVLFFRPQDLRIHKFFAGGSRIDQDKVSRFIGALRDSPDPLNSAQLKEMTGLPKTKIVRLLEKLGDMGAVVCNENGASIVPDKREQLEALIDDVTGNEQKIHEAELHRIEQMRMYAENTGCRRENLLRYFGEEQKSACGFCDNCEKTAAPAVMAAGGEGTRREVVAS